MTPSLVLLAFNLGLKDYDLAWILVNGLLMGFLCLFWSTFMYVGEKLRSKDKGEPNLEMEEKYKFGIISFDNLWFFMKIPWNPIQVSLPNSDLVYSINGRCIRSSLSWLLQRIISCCPNFQLLGVYGHLSFAYASIP